MDAMAGTKLVEPIVPLKSASHPSNPLVFLDVVIGEQLVGRVHIELFKNIVPRTAGGTLFWTKSDLRPPLALQKTFEPCALVKWERTKGEQSCTSRAAPSTESSQVISF